MSACSRLRIKKKGGGEVGIRRGCEGERKQPAHSRGGVLLILAET